jgi:hypothetical protein
MAFRSVLATAWYETQQPVSSVKSVAAQDVEIDFRMLVSKRSSDCDRNQPKKLVPHSKRAGW